MNQSFFTTTVRRLTQRQACTARARMPAGAWIVPILAIAISSNSFAAAIFKSVDENGNVIFTDQPLDGSESVNKEAKKAREIAEAAAAAVDAPDGEQNPQAQNDASDDIPDAEDIENEYLGPTGVLVAPQPVNPPKSDYKEPEEPTRFLAVNGVEILTPIHDAVLIDPLDKIWVELQSYPTPIHETGLTAQLWMNDQLITSGPRPMLSLPAPKRGSHRLQVKLVDDKGQLYIASDTVVIHVKYRVAEQ